MRSRWLYNGLPLQDDFGRSVLFVPIRRSRQRCRQI